MKFLLDSHAFLWWLADDPTRDSVFHEYGVAVLPA